MTPLYFSGEHMGIKYINPNETTKIVSISDSAIDRANSDMVKYQETYDVSHLKFLEGEEPTYFLIGNLGSTEQTTIQQEHYLTELPKLAPGEIPDPKTFKPKITQVRTGEMLIKYFKGGVRKVIDGKVEKPMTDELRETIPSIVIQEIGAIIMQRAFLNDSKKK